MGNISELRLEVLLRAVPTKSTQSLPVLPSSRIRSRSRLTAGKADSHLFLGMWEEAGGRTHEDIN